MPKNNSTKQQPSKNRFLKAINPNTPKKKLLLFVIVFALIGGGYMVYKSFAATGSGVYLAHNLTASGSVSRYNETQGGKKGYELIQVLRGGKVSISTRVQPVIWARNVRACVTANGGGERYIAINLQLHIGGVVKASENLEIDNQATPGFRKLCTPYVAHNDANARVGALVTNKDSGSGIITVSNMSLEYY